MFCIFSYFFMHAPNFWGIKPLNRHFWKFCLLELMKDINRNSFMPLYTNSDAFQSPKKSVCKFDDFDCPQLYLYWWWTILGKCDDQWHGVTWCHRAYFLRLHHFNRCFAMNIMILSEWVHWESFPWNCCIYYSKNVKSSCTPCQMWQSGEIG